MGNKNNGKSTLASRLRKLSEKSTAVDVPGLGEAVYFRSPSTKVAMSLAGFDPQDPAAFERMSEVVSNHTYDEDGHKVFDDKEFTFADLPASVGLPLIESFSSLIKGTADPLAPSEPPSSD